MIASVPKRMYGKYSWSEASYLLRVVRALEGGEAISAETDEGFIQKVQPTIKPTV